MMKSIRRPSSQQGIAIVEATIVLPLVLLLMLSIGEFGRMIYQYHIMTKAVRAGTHHLGPENWHNDDLERPMMEDKIKKLIIYGNDTSGTNAILPGFNTSNISISYKKIPAGSSYVYILIDANYDWQPVFGDKFNTFFGNEIDLSFPLKTSITSRMMTN
ncbi:TadE/TadG family type IV pilus assembly protein [Oceanisphaera sp. KMM 10153]|uniref:TadE/TadG family type IV pilus assembly protein n=1 Tax=Oceanisphaera submarina TaxID=3390193 RepID=UPI00397642A8